MAIRPLGELVSVAQPAWPTVLGWIEASTSAEVLPIDTDHGERVLVSLQVTAASVLGALALNCGGILVDHGWLRLLGGGSASLPDLAAVNGLGDPDTAEAPTFLVVAYDVLGGMFAVDGGGLGVAPGEVCYRGPDTLQWIALGAGHAGFVQAALAGALSDFYDDLRWPGWECEVSAIGPAEGLSVYPPPFTEQGRDIGAASRRPVPFEELAAFYDEMAIKVAALDPNAAIDFRIVE